MTIKVLELFAGVSGLTSGIEAVKNKEGKPVFELFRAVELDKYACETLRNRFGKNKVIEGDLTSKAVHQKVIKECRERVSIIAGGIPCQSFSLIGPRSGYGKNSDKFKQDKRDNLYREFRKIVKEIMPKVVIIENVKGILSKKDIKGKKIIYKLIADFERLGFSFVNNRDGKKFMVLNAADYGVPQFRERVILIGIKKNWKKMEVPYVNPTHFNHDADKSEEQLKEGLLPYVTVFEAIGDLYNVDAKVTNTDLNDAAIRRVKKKNKNIFNGEDRMSFDIAAFKRHMNKISMSGKQYFDFVRPNGYGFIDHHVARSQQLSDIMLFNAMKEGETAGAFVKRMPAKAKKLIKYDMQTFKDKYRKQRRDAPCTTIFAHLEKDGNRFIHPEQHRTITPREAARIQSFPDDFLFSGPMGRKFRQIGNAVPPLMAHHIGKSLYRIFRGQK